MAFFEILSTILIKPLQLLFEIIFSVVYDAINNPGISIIVLSLAINILVLPLYRKADALQEQERNIEAKLDKGVRHIRKTFRGDEQMMILQTYYRQNNYKPTQVLRGALPLFLEIPFFMAAYRFLSNLSLLNRMPFGPIADLGRPDAMLTVAGLTINVLPILMTAVNIVSSMIYSKGYPLKTKLQLYGMAAFFLVFLYDSPSGLVFYWTLNNVFSLVKTIFYKLKNPRKVLQWMCTILSAMLIVLTVVKSTGLKSRLILLAAALLLLMPSLFIAARKLVGKRFQPKPLKSTPRLYYISCLFLAFLTGGLIPSRVIASSPEEFVVAGLVSNPAVYILYSMCLAIGTFVVWGAIFYKLSSDKAKAAFECAIWAMSVIAIAIYMIPTIDMGTLSSTLSYSEGPRYTVKQMMLNALIVAAAFSALWLLCRVLKNKLSSIMFVSTCALCIMLTVNVIGIQSSMNSFDPKTITGKEIPEFNFDRSGKNVVVIMLDRALGEYVPYIMNEDPELMEQFSGFTYYANTLSLGGSTIYATPSLFGGYEYSPAKINAANERSLKDKQNEALRVLPVLMSENNFNVTVYDLPFANYKWYSDMSIFDDHPEIKAYTAVEKFVDDDFYASFTENSVVCNKRNFFVYGVMRCMPAFGQRVLYQSGKYRNPGSSLLGQVIYGTDQAEGINMGFVENAQMLDSLPIMSSVTDEGNNTFSIMKNDLTHSPTLLQMPDYELREQVDNSEYTDHFNNDFTIDGKTLKFDNDGQISHYMANMSAMKRLGKWFDYLRENGVYDNTRIILVADHGTVVNQMDNVTVRTASGADVATEAFMPLLMMKDFDAAGFTTSNEFMTNADVASLVVEGLIENPTNPFTGKALDNSEKTAHSQYVFDAGNWRLEQNTGNTFGVGRWFSVSGDIHSAENWAGSDHTSELPEFEEAR